jgi:hypothetical protein
VVESSDLLEWFRVDRSRGTFWLLFIGITFVFVGAALVACGILSSESSVLHYLTLVGATLLTVGLVTAFGGLTVTLARDEYLAVRRDGVLVHGVRSEDVLVWDELASVKHDPEANAVVFEAVSGPPYVLTEPYTGASRAELAAHLEELRRKAASAPLEYDDVARIALGLPHRRPR